MEACFFLPLILKEKSKQQNIHTLILGMEYLVEASMSKNSPYYCGFMLYVKSAGNTLLVTTFYFQVLQSGSNILFSVA